MIGGVTVATVVVCSECGHVLGIEGFHRSCHAHPRASIKFILVVVPLG